jgi:hypothetical protein
MVSTVTAMGGAQCTEHLASAVQEELKFTLIAEIMVRWEEVGSSLVCEASLEPINFFSFML